VEEVERVVDSGIIMFGQRPTCLTPIYGAMFSESAKTSV
jgi:hypothetical protein